MSKRILLIACKLRKRRNEKRKLHELDFLAVFATKRRALSTDPKTVPPSYRRSQAGPGATGTGARWVTERDGVASARERGLAGIREALNSPEILSLSEAVEESGRSESGVSLLRNNGNLYALMLHDDAQSFRYPRWQFAADPGRLTPVLAALKAKGLSCWAIHDFMIRAHEILGQSAKQAILDETVPLEQIVLALSQRFDEADQGAA